MIFTDNDYNNIADFAFSSNNSGYKPKVIESPNGDGIWDTDKKYAHIAPKYLKELSFFENYDFTPVWYYNKALEEAINICNYLNIPKQFWPSKNSTMRILKYPPGSTTAPHTDFDLFTLSIFRNEIDTFKYLDVEDDYLLAMAKSISPGIHFGEIMTEINGAKATRHEVIASSKEQKSIVFFAVPDHDSILPSGITVGKWLAERESRSRKEI